MSFGYDYSIVVEPESLHSVLDTKKANILLVDLREEEDYIRGHIDISVNMPYDDYAAYYEGEFIPTVGECNCKD